MPDDKISLANALKLRSKELYTLTVMYGQACLLSDKDKASSYWQQIIEGYDELDKLVNAVAKIEYDNNETADILAQLSEV